ncbi:acyl-CoA dehydrogenase family protein [Cupriavidus metallidurans]|uniref:Acyl-CoA dehydrogenase n=1 Tax=Cupriavidus metallidurans (strain ATCC 43123 / DSM 2839 / NBRC 102507 / CH34) TaxID=266264 RepID=Q1LQ46_CUPMC|nr:acyl-CoA dehydrogenase family protein [Cupriavidus metallidurans]ABF07730.1 putative Acyl-CoA dehydrogenase [Cupriavidus metallidurans CH34]QGS27969.1 acyl-CoA dehydrogenase [Cupriavidus metallidurans]
MQLTLTETQTLLESSALHWLAGNADDIRQARDARAYWPAFAEMGWLALPFADADGGFGGGPIEVGLLMRAFGRYRVAAPGYRSGVLMAGKLIAALGSMQQRDTWLAPLITGERCLAMAHTEPGREDPWAMPATTATWDPRGERWTLRGKKSLVTGGADADALVISASIHAEGEHPRIGLFIVPSDADGMTSRACLVADGSRAADLVLDEVYLPDDARLGQNAPEQEIAEGFMTIVAEALVASCWEAAGAMRAALEATVSHVTQREQFGRPLSALQSVQHGLAEMAVCCEEAGAACELAALRIAADRRLARDAASLAQSCTGRAARYVAAQAVQLHGGMGVSEELHVAALFRLLTRFRLQDGHADWHSMQLGNDMYTGDWRMSQTLLDPATSGQAVAAYAEAH